MLLGDRTLDSLRGSASSPEEASTSGQPGRPAEEIRRDLQGVVGELDVKRKQEHSLHIEITEQTAGIRSLNELEEEEASLLDRIAALELELEAAQFAAQRIEEVVVAD